METSMLQELEQSFQRGEFGRVLYRCEQLLQDPANAPSRAILYFWRGKAYEGAGRAWHGEAISSYREGIASASKDRSLKAKLIASLSTIHSLSGDCLALERLIREYQRMARKQQPAALRWGVVLWYNYGVALDNAFRYDDAADSFSRAAVWAGQLDMHETLGACLHNLGGVHLARGHVAEAATAMAQAERLLPDEQYQHKKLSRKAEFFLASGDLVNAQQMVTAALVHPLVDDMTRSDLYYTWARILQSLRRPAESVEHAMIALDCAVKAVHYPGIHKANRLLQQQAQAR
jgi:tetratricopeptide (TPR) repeat protein